MFTHEDCQRIRSMVARTTGQPLPEAVISQSPGLTVTLSNGQAAIAAESRNALARGYFLLARAAREGRIRLNVKQTRHFSSCGIMIDMSRNAVMTVSAVERVLDRMAMLGMNLLLLYTEDTYTVPDYPYLGHLRGRYSQEELREIDDYAASLDIELVPCIQTLGHMEQFLQWSENADLQDKSDILLADSPDTYAFIEAAIASLRSCVRSQRIHVGMDEAHGVGMGRYYEKHGSTNRFQLLNRHLSKVCDICRQYDFHPMMWSDMFFRLGSSKNDYYDPRATIPPKVIAMIPDVDLCYWDYYHTDDSFYEHMLTEHAKMGRTVFAGGLWTWSGFLPHIKRSEATMRPALRACARHQVDTVFATMWGDDGAETNPFLIFNLLPLFSEACWQGAYVPDEEVRLSGECLTGLPDAAFRLFGEFYPSERDRRTGKGLIWCDPLYPLTEFGWETPAKAAARLRKAEQALEPYAAYEECRYARLCFRVAAMKGELLSELRPRYLAGDRAYLRTVVDTLIPALQAEYRALTAAHRALWERDMKRFGWEVLALRYGAIQGRLSDVQDEIQRYLAGTLPAIVELDEEPLPAFRRADQHFLALTVPGVGI